MIIKQFTNNDVTRAGEFLKSSNLDDLDFSKNMEILTYWRESHIQPLNIAEKLLSPYVSKVDKNAFIAKRIKRLESIQKKLKRFSRMELKNMQDIGGIRVVVSSLKQVNDLKEKLLTNHKDCFFNNCKPINIDDYILHPKDDGYRCLHLVGKFKNHDNKDRKVELQIRTRLQHSWATTLEIIDIFTEQDLKSNQGYENYQQFLKRVSEQFAIIEEMDNFNIANPDAIIESYVKKLMNDRNLLNNCKLIFGFFNRKMGMKTVGETLQEYSKLIDGISEDNSIKKDGYLLTRLNTKNNRIDTEFFSIENKDDALNKYALYEQTSSKNKKWVIALISTNALGGLKEAYPNYFADCNLFIQFVNRIILSTILAEHNIKNQTQLIVAK